MGWFRWYCSKSQTDPVMAIHYSRCAHILQPNPIEISAWWHSSIDVDYTASHMIFFKKCCSPPWGNGTFVLSPLGKTQQPQRVNSDLSQQCIWCKSALTWSDGSGPGKGVRSGMHWHHQSCFPPGPNLLHSPPTPPHSTLPHPFAGHTWFVRPLDKHQHAWEPLTFLPALFAVTKHFMALLQQSLVTIGPWATATNYQSVSVTSGRVVIWTDSLASIA